MAKRVRFGGVIARVLWINLCAVFTVSGLAVVSFIVSPHIKINGAPVVPLIPPLVVIVIGFTSVLYILPLVVRLRCPKCKRKTMRYDRYFSLSLHCQHCGVEKYTWFHIG